MRRKYTHSKGFNVTSLKDKAGIYFFRDEHGDIIYIGMCNNDFKNRINSHAYGEHGKLNSDVHYIHVILVDPIVYPIHVLEHLFIWLFDPIKNRSLWIFNRDKGVKETANSHNLNIEGTVKDFLFSFDNILIQREWDKNGRYKRYGEVESLASKRIVCSKTASCLCFHCLVKRGRKIKN
ncbi:GIY-YIG nuclease family protein [Priestia megaterium]|uniref:GIY-YIG nuclease family protein n=1 Tax=Priestia megaterium TaxID=1404 RepID=UPI002E240586|nr:GIY-YIG nuclease family protein [Priestia megaterium]MED4210809.1 GIY-YIG nuclease family protein [Priestia megaterium]